MVSEKMCTVCGYEMEEGPRDYNICPCCGTEFGLHDVNSTVDNLRGAWLECGAKWHSTVVPQPQGWKPAVQLARLLFSGDYAATEQGGEVMIEPAPQIVFDSQIFNPAEKAA